MQHQTHDNTWLPFEPVQDGSSPADTTAHRLTDRAPVFLWESEPDGEITFLNQTWLDFTGRTMEQELDNGWMELIHPDDIAALMATWQAVQGTDKAFEMLYRARRHDGEFRWLHGTAIPRYSDEGMLTGYVGAAVDVTERKRREDAEQARERETWEIRQQELLGSMAGNLAHELNSLFTAILGYAELVQNALPSHSQPFADLTRLQAATQQAARLTRQMLDYSGQSRARLQWVDVNALVQERTSEHANAPINISIATKLDPNLPSVKADPRLIDHVLSALLTNAVEAIGTETGFITVTTRLLPADAADLTAGNLTGLPAGDYVQISVADTGQGMDAETLSHIFEPFFSTKFTGRGLGLAAAQGIARSHQGGLFAESRLGWGSTFHLLLPVASPS